MPARLPPLALLRTVGRTASPSRPPHPRQYLPQAWLACLGRVVIFIPLIVPDSAWGRVTQSPGAARGSRGGAGAAVLAGNPNGTIASLTRYRCALTLTASKLGTPSAYFTAHGENARTPAAGTALAPSPAYPAPHYAKVVLRTNWETKINDERIELQTGIKTDITESESRIQAKIAELEAGTKVDIGAVRADVGVVRTEIGGLEGGCIGTCDSWRRHRRDHGRRWSSCLTDWTPASAPVLAPNAEKHPTSLGRYFQYRH